MMEDKLEFLQRLQKRLVAATEKSIATYRTLNLTRQLSADPGEIAEAELAFIVATANVGELKYLISLVEKDIKS